ncbi:hypothetical protein UFOVP190_329 [uncultured Caudovirales phage]|uniref:Uncharacterized protein n=1 Tax=uncultured Caudovirales phage TaxID=2100421 RepID=A0A6J7WGX5_9CAUD|nr:hypothetical protein UFOVP190_329 [uncultured Caudovirales phage]
MNRRIRELAEQAGFEITLWSNESVPCVHQEGPIDVELEKFAELIVKKCIFAVEDAGGIDKYHYTKAIREHFGVEE